jgi:hypothetical protein
MFNTNDPILRAARCALTALILSLPAACSSDEPEHSERTGGGENALDRAGRRVDAAHKDFKEEVKPAAQWVDEKTKEAVGEGKKAVKKSAEAVEDAVE